MSKKVFDQIAEGMREPKPVTIHDQAREQFELAMTYAEDGALGTAARIIREIADAYGRRDAEIRSMGYGNYVKRGGRG